MKGDFSRITFDPEKHYSSVRMQQGRVQMDADWNEQLDIEAHRDETTHRDVIGHCGGPLGTDNQGNELAGFKIELNQADLTISGGRYYVHGILCENDEEDASLLDQPDWPTGLTPIDTGSSDPLPTGEYLVYLDVWQRHLTYLDDGEIREVALGGPDTATRTKAVWQAKLLQVPEGSPPTECAQFGADWSPDPRTPGTLAARAEPDPQTTDPCIVPAEAGFRRLENQLYRVQIHDGGTVAGGNATFKFSRENGTVVAQWEDQDDDILTVSSSGRDEVVGFSAGDWVEITDDQNDLTATPGVFVRVLKVEGRELTIEQPSPVLNIKKDFRLNPKIRRWESTDGEAELLVEIPAENDGFIELEDGVQIKFDDIGEYRSGDYWVMPARTETGTIDWPTDPASGSPDPEPAQLPPHGIEHRYCPLAIAHFDGANWDELRGDCRCLFPTLKDLKCLYYVSGDGQEVAPDPLAASNTTFPLLAPLKVGVSLGRWPVEGATVRFEIVVAASGGILKADADQGQVLDVTTDADGIATCNWELNGQQQSQQVSATLLDSAQSPLHIPITFTANLSRARHVAYDPDACPELKDLGVKDVQDAIDALCQRTERGGCAVTVGREGEFEILDGPNGAIAQLLKRGVSDLCICLLPGDHQLANSIEVGGRNLNLRIAGCGRATRLRLGKQRLQAEKLASFTLKDLWIDATTGFVECTACRMVALDGCHLRGTNVRQRALVTIGGAERIRLSEGAILAMVPGVPEPFERVLAAVDRPELIDLFGDLARPDFRERSVSLARDLAGLSLTARRKVARDVRRAVNAEAELQLSGELRVGLEAVAVMFGAAKVGPDPLAAGFVRIRDAAVRGSSALALAIIDGGADTLLDHMDIVGMVLVYGQADPLPPDFIDFIHQQRDQRVTITIASVLDSDCQMRNNRFRGRVTILDDVVQIRSPSAIELGDPTRGVFRKLLMTNNVFEAAFNQFGAREISFSECHFTNPSPEFDTYGVVFCESSIYVGIHAPNDAFLFDISNQTAKAAILGIGIVEV